MTTLESRYAQRVAELAGTDALVEYMLDAVPFIRDYHAEPVAGTDRQAMRGAAVDGFATSSRKGNKHGVYQQYLEEVEKDYETARARPARALARDRDPSMCADCDIGMVVNTRESRLVCPKCGRTRLDTDSMCLTYNQEVEQTTKVTTFAYKRMNHFTEWLNTVQGKEKTEIPATVIDAVRAEFKKERAMKRSDVTPEKVHAFLKKLRLNKYYDNKYAICHAVSGVPPPRLPQHLEDTLRQMFNDIQKPFETAKPASRKNFLSYGFVLHKFVQLLGEVSLTFARSRISACSPCHSGITNQTPRLPPFGKFQDGLSDRFPLLKSPEKLRAQDMIWEKICKELGWEFIHSI